MSAYYDTTSGSPAKIDRAKLIAAALALAASGIPVFPCKATKAPCVANGFHAASTDPDTVRRLFGISGACLIGMPTGEASGIDALDLDPRHGSDEWRARHLDRMPGTRVHGTPGLNASGPAQPGEHWLFRHADGVRNAASDMAPGVDVRGTGGYIIVPPSPGYSLINEADLAPWPAWLLALVVKPALPELSARPEISETIKAGQLQGRYRAFVVKLLANVSAAPDGEKHNALLRNARTLGGIIAAAGISEAEAHGSLIEALPASVLDAENAKRTATAGLRDGMAAPITLEDRPRPNWDVPPAPPVAPAKPAPESTAPAPKAAATTNPLHGFELTEDGVALAFTAAHKDTLRYCHGAAAWYEWTGTYWRIEITRKAFAWVREIARQQAEKADFPNKKQVGKKNFAVGVEVFAQSDRAHAVTAEQWDRDPFLLGTPGGTVDLKNAELHPARQVEFITKQTAVAPAETPDCPIWDGFMHQLTGGDAGFIRFLRQWCGYCLTGDISEHALLFGYGPGGNGKSVFLNTVQGIMGDYAVSAGMEVFTASQHDRHPAELARLHGARLVTASETEEGRNWAATRIKNLTGGDRITARHLYKNAFEFVPQFKITIMGNNKPGLANVDIAIKRRYNLAPFLHEPTTPDPDLEAKLRAEWPAILRWMIEGGLDWQKNRLARPEVTLTATAEYFAEQDYFARWLGECCTVDYALSEKPGKALDSFAKWCLANGEPTPDARRFRAMVERQKTMKYSTTAGISWIRGFALKTANTVKTDV